MSNRHAQAQQQNPMRFAPRDVQEDGVKAFLVSADALWRSGDFAQAELKFRQALRQAELIYGCNHIGVAVVLSIMARFYQSQERTDEADELELRIKQIELAEQSQPAAENQPASLRDQLLHKRDTTSRELPRRPRAVPVDVRRSCQLLGLAPEDLSVEKVNKAWKDQMRNPSVHPDLGGNTESAVLLNKAKDTLVQWLEEQTPKLGKQFDNIVNK